MRSDAAGTELVETGRLDDRVLGTLQELGGLVTFSGLRRVLAAHPESLSRSLRRLEREGLVERADGGYRALAGPGGIDLESVGELRTVAHLELPRDSGGEARLRRLAGRWFGSLRWVGEVVRPSGRLLAWARRDGAGLVMLRWDPGAITVLVPGTPEAGDFAEAEEAGFELLYHALRSVRPLREPLAPRRGEPLTFRAWPSGAVPLDN
jgi:DNA-binding Lrp family transcriptional regulator